MKKIFLVKLQIFSGFFSFKIEILECGLLNATFQKTLLFQRLFRLFLIFFYFFKNISARRYYVSFNLKIYRLWYERYFKIWKTARKNLISKTPKKHSKLSADNLFCFFYSSPSNNLSKILCARKHSYNFFLLFSFLFVFKRLQIPALTIFYIFLYTDIANSSQLQ